MHAALRLDARLKIAEGRPEEAIQDLQTGFAMARHTAAAPILINGLVGAAIARMMMDQLYEITAMRTSENLYWNLAVLSAPLIDFRPAFEFEGESIYLLCPQLRDAAMAQRSESQWQADLNDLLKSLEVLEPLTKGETKSTTEPKLLDLVALAANMAHSGQSCVAGGRLAGRKDKRHVAGPVDRGRHCRRLFPLPR